MRVAIVGRGKMAEEMRRIGQQESVQIVDLSRLEAGDVVLHFGSGRELTATLAACARAGVPLIQGATSVALPETLPVPVVEAPNLAIVVIQFMAALKPWAGHVKAIRESHQSGKRDVSGTARLLADRLRFPTSGIESIRDRAQQLERGVPAEHLDGHAYHWVECERDGVQLDVAIRIVGREPYARGGFALARVLSQRKLENRRYGIEEILG